VGKSENSEGAILSAFGQAVARRNQANEFSKDWVFAKKTSPD
jgi:hypothetical protein